MTDRKDRPVSARESKAEQTTAAATAQVASDATRMRDKTERLRAQRLAKEAIEKKD